MEIIFQYLDKNQKKEKKIYLIFFLKKRNYI